MAYFSALLFYTALSSIVVLLLTGGIKKLQPWNKLATAILLTFLALEWIGLPQTWRYVMSAWSPGSVLHGWFVLDMQPVLWQWGAVIGILFAAVAWLDVAQKRVGVPLSGVLVVVFLITLWLLLLSGSLLMTVSLWAVFDLVWCVASLMIGIRSQRVLLATSVQGIVSVILWSVTLFNLRNGDSGLWWLLSPDSATSSLLLFATMIRTGVFGFQLVTAETPRTSAPLSLIHVSGVLAGLMLLYRVLSLHGLVVPTWSILWPVLSCVWYGFLAWNRRGLDARLAASMVALMAIVSVGILTQNTALLAQSAAPWLAAMFVLLQYRRRDPAAIQYSWWTWLVTLVMLGLPISSVGVVYMIMLRQGPWLGRIALILGAAFSTAAMLRDLQSRSEGSNRISLVQDRIPIVWSQVTMLFGVFVLARQSMHALPQESLVLALGLWLLAFILGGALLRADNVTIKMQNAIRPIVDLLGLEWLYQAIWDGAEVLLGVVRIAADVVEGRGSLLWSVLILLLVMMVVVGS